MTRFDIRSIRRRHRHRDDIVIILQYTGVLQHGLTNITAPVNRTKRQGWRCEYFAERNYRGGCDGKRYGLCFSIYRLIFAIAVEIKYGACRSRSVGSELVATEAIPKLFEPLLQRLNVSTAVADREQAVKRDAALDQEYGSFVDRRDDAAAADFSVGCGTRTRKDPRARAGRSRDVPRPARCDRYIARNDLLQTAAFHSRYWMRDRRRPRVGVIVGGNSLRRD